jgi:uncharacterized protein
MDITPVIPSEKKIITSYGGGIFKINNNESFTGNIIVYPNEIISWQAIESESITIESIMPFIKNTENIEVLLIGCGTEHQSAPKELVAEFRTKGIGIEMMTTGAACRTYNVLLGEGRNIAAALIAV